MKSISTIFPDAICNTLKGLFLILLCVFFSNPLSAQWQAYTPQLSDTVGAVDLRIAPTDAQTAWCGAMKYKVTYDTYNWVPTENLFFTKTTDGGNTWTGAEIPMGVEPFLSNISPISANTAWVSGLDVDYSNYVLRTEDGGATWTRFLEAGFVDPTSYVDLVHFWDDKNGIAVGDPTPGPGHPEAYFEIYRTEDGGGKLVARTGRQYSCAGGRRIRLIGFLCRFRQYDLVLDNRIRQLFNHPLIPFQ